MKKLIGTIIKGNGEAGKRLKLCHAVLAKNGLKFPPLHYGTINILLEDKYKTPNGGIIIPYCQLDELSQINKEYWKIIPVESVNGRKVAGFILRTSINIHGERVVELITELMNLNEKNIEIEVNE